MKTIHVVTDIAAPVATVWSVLTAASEYADWNPFHHLSQGRTGGRQPDRCAHRATGGDVRCAFVPRSPRSTKGKRLEWLGRLVLPGIVDGRHSFALVTLGDGRTRFTQSEQFSGFLVPFATTVLERTRAGFEAMNDALRLRAEQAVATEAVT
jgi:hypothetical protein